MPRLRLWRWPALFPGILTVALVGAAPERTDPPRVVRARYLMGTIFRFEAPPSDAAGMALDAALDEVQRLGGVLGKWDRESERPRLNGRAGTGAIPVSADLLAAVSSALHWARETEGAFDPTVEPLTRSFRREFSRESTPVGPAPGLPAAVVGWRRIRL